MDAILGEDMEAYKTVPIEDQAVWKKFDSNYLKYAKEEEKKGGEIAKNKIKPIEMAKYNRITLEDMCEEKTYDHQYLTC